MELVPGPLEGGYGSRGCWLSRAMEWWPNGDSGGSAGKRAGSPQPCSRPLRRPAEDGEEATQRPRGRGRGWTRSEGVGWEPSQDSLDSRGRE